MTGRRTLLTSEMQAAVCAGIEAGLPLRHVAGESGVHVQTLLRWIATGEKEIEAAPDTDPADLSPQARFALAVAASRAAKVRRFVSVLEKSSSTPHLSTGMLDPRGAMFILERTEPRDFKSHQAIEADVALRGADAKAELGALIDRLAPVAGSAE